MLIDIGKMYVRITGEWRGRTFCYFGGAKVFTFGSVWDGSFKVEPTTDHRELLDECRKQLQANPEYAAVRESKAKMSWQGSAVYAERVQTKNRTGTKRSGRKGNT